MLRPMQSWRYATALCLLLASLPSVATTHTWDASIQEAAEMKHQEAAERQNQTLAFNNTNSSSCVMVCSTAEQDHGDHAVFQHPPPDGTPATWAILFFFVCLLLGVGTRQILAKVQEKTGLRIPSTVGLLAVGMVLGAIIWEETISAVPNEMFSVSTMVWEIMDPKLILFMFLPCLIFEGSMSTDFFVFSKQFVGGMVLAFPGMVLQILMVAGFAMYCFPYGWGFGESMLFGSILSATDPVAVIALMKELALLGDLRVLIEAESLLNDGSAIVAYELCHIVLVHPGSVGDYISLAVTLTICAPLMGAACFFAMRLWVNKTTDPIQETVLTVAAAYLCYYLCESGLHISGVLSVLTLGLLYNGYGSSAMSSEEAHHMCHSFWEIFVWVADTIIFVLAGILIIQEGFLSNSFTWVGNDWGYLVALYLALFVFRILMVIVCAPVLRYTCFGMQHRVCSRERFFKYMFILSWGGLRGIVGLVLAMVVSLDHHLGAAVSDKQYCVRVLIHVAGIVVLTTLLNAASLELLIDKLGLKAPSIIETQLVQDSVSTLSRRNKAYIQEAQNLRELCRVHWESVNAIVGLEDSLLQDKTNIGNPHDVGLQRENPHVLEKSEKSPDIVNVGPTFGASQDEERISKMEQYFHLQYLLALKCSFDGQYKDGLLSGSAFRQLSWAMNTALDHCYDMEPLIRKRMKFQKETQIGDRFEWGWLIEEGFLDQPRWLSYCTIFGSKFSEHCTRVDNARRMELFLAISRAHDAAEFDLDICPEYAAHFIQESKQIKVQAEKEYAALALLSPDIASAVTTRQTCQLVLKDYLHQVEILFESAQLKATDFASMKEDILSKRRKLLDYLPKTDETFISKLRQENLRRYFPEDSRLIKKMTKQRFKAGEMVLDGKRIAEAIYFIEQGTVQLQFGEDEGGLTMCGDGCCINDTQVLIDDAGFEFENVSDVIAVTDATLHCLTFQSLRDINDELGKHEKDSFVHKLWQHAGSVLSLRCPELFDFSTPPAAFQWASATMVVKEKGASLILSGRCLLVQGVLEKWSRPSAGESRSNLRRNKNNVNKQEAELNTIEAFAYLSPTECDGYAFTVLTDNCKLLLSPQTICKKADEANVELSTRRPEASVPENEEVPGDEDGLVWGCDWGCGFVGTASVVRKHEHTCDQRRRQREQSRTSKEHSLARGPTRGGLSSDSLPEHRYTRRASVASLSCDSMPAQLAVCYSRRSSLYSVPPLLPSPLEAACTTRQHAPHTIREQHLEAELQTADGTSAKSRRRKSLV